METAVKEIKVTYKDQEVAYNIHNKTWSYAGVGENAVKLLSPDKYEEITSLLNKEVAEFQERVKKEADEKKAKILKERLAKLEEFKKEVNPLIPSGFTVKFARVDDDYYGDIDSFYIERGNVDAYINKRDTVYGRSYYGSKTDRPWVVQFGYKNHRFSSLSSAIKNATNKINEKLELNAAKAKAEEEKKKATQTLSNRLSDAGIIMKVERHVSYNYYGRGKHSYYETEQGIIVIKEGKDKEYPVLSIVGNVWEDEKTKNITLGRVSVAGGVFTISQFKQLAEFVKNLKVEKE